MICRPAAMTIFGPSFAIAMRSRAIGGHRPSSSGSDRRHDACSRSRSAAGTADEDAGTPDQHLDRRRAEQPIGIGSQPALRSTPCAQRQGTSPFATVATSGKTDRASGTASQGSRPANVRQLLHSQRSRVRGGSPCSRPTPKPASRRQRLPDATLDDRSKAGQATHRHQFLVFRTFR